MTASIEVVSLGAPVMVQDGGRPGHMHHGVPPGGAWVPELLIAANRAVGNAWSAAALEAYGRLELRARGRDVRVSVDGEAARLLADGDTLTVPAPTRYAVRYVAVDGALSVPEVLGGRGTLGVARLGGWEGRPLRKGDSLPLGPPVSADSPSEADLPRLAEALDPTAPVRILLGPDTARFGDAAVAMLLGSTFTVSPASDRVGQRLDGPPVPHGDEGTGTSRPMVRGALQVTLSGTPIVLGPDHPTTGGYPLIAVVIRADWGRLGARRAGASVHFQAVSVEEARAAWSHRPA
ncbi:biotin-dependent carboxyltransferase family protein [Corallococcus praedator]|uniref:Biotin-dependent carboxyltransferase family protein n=1 Tax=Corallococcus praedator TaxID=2316724 RepID=A0ABX9Q8J3_9BACT|nr:MULTISPECIES: biotin-dependent carboxyltransferase family protein [Corallococcus]RKH35526.1 biotin-dependent carboxyltransferase family protein [Corallococcus sp. CA031C]RKH93693.1 biotin-dependent carboxyltransferase family protein [Corallococcus praedator]